MAKGGKTFNKVNASATGAAVAAALVVVVMWVLDKYVFLSLGMPDYVHGALETLITALIIAAVAAAGSYLAGYQAVEKRGYRKSYPS